MPQVVVIADDLTGGNATGVQLRQSSFNCVSVLNFESLKKDRLPDCDCVIYPTDSRAVPEKEAYRRVYEACKALMSPEVKVYSKRIDSTLRGNIGAETDAMHDALGDDWTAIVVPSFPSSGRTVVGGYLMVNGVLLNKTDIAIDPKCPVKVSKVRTVLSGQTRKNISGIYADDLMHGKHALAEIIKGRVAGGDRIITVDAVTQEDLDLIADAVITSGIKCLAVDSGAFTGALARKAATPSRGGGTSRILVVVGSVHPLTAAQVDHLRLTQRTVDETVRTREFLESEARRESEIARVAQSIISRHDKFPVSTVIGDGLKPELRIDFKPYMQKSGKSLDELSHVINASFAEIAARIFEKEKSYRALYCCGGDITVAVCSRVKAQGIRLEDEVLPLAAYGTIAGGELDGVHIVTKGGSQGGPEALNECVNYLKKRLSV